MYLPGMNFAGPGIRLDLRLDEDRSPKDFSKPVNRVDGAAYRHDLACVTFPNTKRRNVADGKWLRNGMKFLIQPYEKELKEP